MQMKLMDLPEVSESEPATALPDIEPLVEPVPDDVADDGEAENEAGDSE